MKNLTIKLDEALLKKSRMLALEQDMSLSQWIGSLLFKELMQRIEYQQARTCMLTLMHQGLDLGGKPLSREKAHER